MNASDNHSNELSPWVFRIVSWVIAITTGIIYFVQKGKTFEPPQTWLDGTFLWASFLFLVLPFFRAIRLGNILELKQDIEKTRQEVSELKVSMSFLTNQSNKNNIFVYGSEGVGKEPNKEQQALTLSPSGSVSAHNSEELKILNTLWIFQVDKFPDLMPRFTFRVGLPSFDAAANNLLFEGLIGINPEGQVFITNVGLDYCAHNYTNFPTDSWFPSPPPDSQKLTKALEAIKNLQQTK